MKKLVLVLSVVFVTMSSFSKIDTLPIPSNCEQTCAFVATYINWHQGGDFDDEVTIFENCVNTSCAQQ